MIYGLTNPCLHAPEQHIFMYETTRCMIRSWDAPPDTHIYLLPMISPFLDGFSEGICFLGLL